MDSQVVSYKCLSCGSPLAYDKSGKLKCSSCDAEYDLETLEKFTKSEDGDREFDWKDYKKSFEQNKETLEDLAQYCDEFLVHAADVEGRGSGIDRDLVGFLSGYKRVPITYAGGVHDYSDIETISYLSDNNMDFTVGSCLDLFGGKLSYERIIKQISTRE